MSITSNLYPPIVYDTQASFIRTKTCRIYFSLSVYNSITDIKNVQVSLVNQQTNASAFKTDSYPSGIKITNLFYDSDKQDDYKYYIQINPSDLAEGVFGLNQFYKVQLRFTSISASTPPSDGKELASWLYDNMQHFSEWSKVCLIKGIEQPQISIYGFSNAEDTQETVLTSPIVEVVGALTYANNSTTESEYLKSYNIKLYQAENPNTVLMDSGQIYTNTYNPNQINYEISYDLMDGIDYILTLTYTTNNSYTETIQYKFIIIQYDTDILNVDIIATTDQENGRIKIDILSKNEEENFIGNLTIRRTSSKSDFHKWEDVKNFTHSSGGKINFTWYDTTIESGIWYKYCVQKRNTRGSRGAVVMIDNPVMCLLDDIFLTKEDCQLKIKFNPSLNEFKYNVTESQQVTLGSKYPFIKRNGANYFRTFPIGGLISSFIDTSDWYDPHFYDGEFHSENELKLFASKDEIYGNSKQLYDNYNSKNNITEYNDYIYEREFRNKVYDFLYKHDVKLFRSTTEGNILIKLMDIDFQPVESLGRRLYSFTATAVEIDDATLSNYNKYNIQTIGNYETYVAYEHPILGQSYGTYDINDGNIITSIISNKYKKFSKKGYVNQVDNLKWLKLTIESEPYVIIENNGQLIKADASSNINSLNATIGYIVIINDIEIIIPCTMERRPKNLENGLDNEIEIIHLGFFELKEQNTSITNLQFKYPTTVMIDYVANLKESEDTSRLTSRIYYYYKSGQLYGTFYPQTSLIHKIYNKYLLNYNKYYQRLLDVTEIQIEGPKNAIVYIKDSQDSDFNRHILQNEYLQLKDSSATIEGLYFCGIHLTKEVTNLDTDNIYKLRDNQFIFMEGRYESFSDIQNPVKNGVYKIFEYGVQGVVAYNPVYGILTAEEDSTMLKIDKNYCLILQDLYDNFDNQYIYYNNKWWPFTQEHDVLCPVQGIVDYYCQVVKGVY